VLQTFFEWLQNTSLAVKVGEDWFPYVESAHASRHLRFTYVSDRLLPWTWGAFIGAAITGSLLFMANAISYAANVPFRYKMVLLLLAGLNMLFFQLVTFRKVGAWDNGTPAPAARLAGLLSIGLWCAVIVCGRWVGFV
jgi:hypothetical protein